MMKRLYTNSTSGATGPRGQLFYRLVDGRKKPWFVRKQDLLSNPAGTFRGLAAQGFAVGGRTHVAQLLEDARAVTDFPAIEVIESSGWAGPAFALPSGKVIGSKAAREGTKPGVSYVRHPDRHCRDGKLEDWQTGIANAASRSDAIAFAVGLPFAAVIRTLLPRPVAPFGVEFITDRHQGMLQQAMLSVAGSMKADKLRTDPVQELVSSPSSIVAASRDHLLVIGEIGGFLCGASDKKRNAATRSLIFDHLLHSGGGDENSSGGPAPIFAMIEKVPLREQLELDDAACERLQEGMLTIPVPADLWGKSDDADAADGAPRRSATRHGSLSSNYGVALKTFICRVVEARAEGLDDLKEKLSGWESKYLRKAATLVGETAADQALIEAFALVCVGLHLAKELAVLPKVIRPKTAMIRLLTAILQDRPRPQTAGSILMDIAARSDVRNVDDIDENMSREDFDTIPAFIKVLKDRKRELWVTTENKKEMFHWPSFHKLPDFDMYYRGKGEKDRNGVKRRIGGHNPRVLRFRLPE